MSKILSFIMTAMKPLLDSLNKAHITHNDIQALIDMCKNLDGVNVQKVGESFEHRSIHLLSMGNGPTVIFAWTQMHGNEATATAAIFDLIYQLHEQSSNLPPSIANTWQQQFTLHLLPMLNPDGAQRCIRQNAQGIDINRDAKALQTPEGRLLMHLVDHLKPHIGFNLHDQSPYYQCGQTGNPATIAFLAPAFDDEKTIDASRQLAMQIINAMNRKLQTEIPNCVARYDDTYSHRSFGDNIAAKQISTILIESGAAMNDPNRQLARRLNVTSIINAMDYLTISCASRDADSEQDKIGYFSIPENVSEALSSLVLTELNFNNGSKYHYQAGVSIKQTARYSDRFYVEFVGDLGFQSGLQVIDCSALHYKQGKCYPLTHSLQLTEQTYKELLSEGYVCFYAQKQSQRALLDIQTKLPVLFSSKPNIEIHTSKALTLNDDAFFLLASHNNIVAAVLNGRFVRLLHAN